MNNRAQNQFTTLNNSLSPMTGEKFHDVIYVDGSGGPCTYILPVEDELNVKNGHMITFITDRETIDNSNVLDIQSNGVTGYPIIDQGSLKIQYSPLTYSLTYLNKIWWPTHLLTTTRMVDLQIHNTAGSDTLTVGTNRFPVVIPKEYRGWYIQNVSYVLGTAGLIGGSNNIQININGITPVAASAVSMGVGVATAEALAVRQQVAQYDRIFLQVTATTTTPGSGLFGVLTLSQV